MSDAEIIQWINHLKDRSGYDIHETPKLWSTKYPSIQGIWTPLETKEPVLSPKEILADLEELCACKSENQPPTAEEELIDLAHKQSGRLSNS
ncbi:39S ribosomal protein L43, mitochondrial [Cichlidogyrus casuarinus]|uniref:39S ribosomal protein L43, mitochondrial n=1 Tax=Cichlidogyrus casuarinus TaxID=1844966 RepID=A0ABD2QAQ8_9PLAT